MTTVIKILNQIENKELVLPEFQREFTWNRDQAKKLIASFLSDFPTGALLFWKTKENIALKNMPDFTPDGRVEVILDGQQRLTTLYLLIKDDIPLYYSSKDIGEGKDIRHLYYNLETGELEYYKKTKMQYNPRWVKVTDCYKGDKIDDYDIAEEISQKEDIGFKTIFKKLKNNLTKLRNIKEKDYKIIYVKDTSNLREALTVFDRINSAGTPLSQADIALAHMCSRWPETRRTFKDKIREIKKYGFEFDLTFLVRAMNAVVNKRAEYKQLHDKTEEELKEGFYKLEGILDYLVNILRDRAYIYGTDDLNTTNVLIPIIGYLSLYGPEFNSEYSMKKMFYWMYAALYKRRFTSSVDQKLEDDLSCLKPDYTPNKDPIDDLLDNLREDQGDPEVKKSNLCMRGIIHPLYNMANIVIRAKGGFDWSKGINLSQPYGKKYRVECHHIFPHAVLLKNGYETTNLHHQKLINEIANRVPLTKKSNMEIFTKEPREYFSVLEKKYPGNLERFFIPMNKKLWKVKNFEGFLDKRRELIAESINEFMKRLIEGKKTEEAESIASLIQQNEGKTLEFKSSLRWNLHQEDWDKNLEEVVVKTISAFLNASGGQLLIGVKDDGTILGLEKDLERFGNEDKFELHLSNIIEANIGKNFMPYIHIEFHEVKGKTICLVSVEKSPRPAYLRSGNQERFFVRLGNHSKELSIVEAQDYIKEHWQ